MNSRRRFAMLSLVGALALSLTACDGPPPDLSPSPNSTHVADPSPAHTDDVEPPASPTATAEPSTPGESTAQPSGEPTSTPASPAPGKTPGKDPKPGSTPAKTPAKDPKPAETPVGGTANGRWKPPAKATWQWQLSGRLDTSVDAQVFDVDLYDTSAAQVKALHAKGSKVICYLSAGSYEKGRPDSAKFPSSVLGETLDGWPDERWLDIRNTSVLLPIMAARMDLCKSKGFDAVEPDNIDGYQNDSGFPLTAAHQLAYNKALAKLAHDRGLAIGLKNDIDQVSALQSSFDFAVNEECYAYNECSVLSAFIKAGKPVFHVEYDVAVSKFCPATTKLGFSSMRKNLDLDASRTPCH